MMVTLLLYLLAAAPVAPRGSLIAVESRLELHSNLLLNLHHVLHAAAGDRTRPADRVVLREPVEARLRTADLAAWKRAVTYYADRLASRDLRTGDGMTRIKQSLVNGDLSALDPAHREALQSVLPAYRERVWPAHDADNRRWAGDFVDRFRPLASTVLPALEKALATRWPSAPVRVDMVWAAKPTPYTTVRPLHVVMPSTDPRTQGWWGVELMLHETTHGLIGPIEEALRRAFVERGHEPGDAWHAALFYVTGDVLRRALASTGITYTPYLYQTGLFDRAWRSLRPALEAQLGAYLDGRRSLSAAAAGIAAAAKPQGEASRLTAVRGLVFHSDFLVNLHHTLFAAAWAARPEREGQRRLAEPLPVPLETAAMSESDRRAWEQAVTFYDRQIASRDLLFGRGMESMKTAIIAGDLSNTALAPEHRQVLESAGPIYRRYFWPDHDRRNRAWIDATAAQLRTVADEVIGKLEAFYGVTWFSSDVRIDVVWVGNRQGAYTTVGPPPHATISHADPATRGWVSVELVFHEVSHVLVLPLQKQLESALGAAVREHSVLWHVVQFHLTGAAVQEVLRARGIEYEPMLYTGLVDRAWPQYKKAVLESWTPYVQGKISREDAIAATVAAVSR